MILPWFLASSLSVTLRAPPCPLLSPLAEDCRSTHTHFFVVGGYLTINTPDMHISTSAIYWAVLEWPVPNKSSCSMEITALITKGTLPSGGLFEKTFTLKTKIVVGLTLTKIWLFSQEWKKKNQIFEPEEHAPSMLFLLFPFPIPIIKNIWLSPILKYWDSPTPRTASFSSFHLHVPHIPQWSKF